MSTVEQLSSTINEGSQQEALNHAHVRTDDELSKGLPTIPNWSNAGETLSSIHASNATTTDEPNLGPETEDDVPAPTTTDTDVPRKAKRRLSTGTLAAPPSTGAVFAAPFRTYTGPPGMTLEEIKATATSNRLPRQLGGSISIASSVSLTDDVAEEAFDNMKIFRDEIRAKVKDFITAHDAALHGVGDSRCRLETSKRSRHDVAFRRLRSELFSHDESIRHGESTPLCESGDVPSG